MYMVLFLPHVADRLDLVGECGTIPVSCKTIQSRRIILAQLFPKILIIYILMR
jgi:hypothetical protein